MQVGSPGLFILVNQLFFYELGISKRSWMMSRMLEG